jgi:hypothetical protein
VRFKYDGRFRQLGHDYRPLIIFAEVKAPNMTPPGTNTEFHFGYGPWEAPFEGVPKNTRIEFKVVHYHITVFFWFTETTYEWALPSGYDGT